MQKIQTVEELCDFIWYLENKYCLLDFEVDGVKPWQAFRIEIYYMLGKECGVFDEHLQRGPTKFQKAVSLLSLIKNSILNNPLIGLRKVDFLVFTHSRSKSVDQNLIDIYSDDLIYNLNKVGSSYFELEEQFKGKHLRKNNKYKKYLDYINLVRNIKSKFIVVEISKEQKETLRNVAKEIELRINKQFNIESILVNRTKKFLSSYNIYFKLLEKTKPKTIYVLISYARSEMILAARKLGIEVIELQHGTFSKYHLGYSFPNRKKLDYFPDKIYVWNEYWKKLIKFPLEPDNIVISPFLYLEKEKQKYTSINKSIGQIAVLGQGGVTDRMAKVILENWNLFEFNNVIFKLHPEEYGRAHLYGYLQKLLKKENVCLVEDVDMYLLLSESEWQLGVSSTAIYEGKEFYCKTMLIDLPGVEYMTEFIKHYSLKKYGCFYIEP